MAELSNYLENSLLDHVLRGTSYTSPTTVYVGLYTSDPGDDNSGTECTGGAYARQILSVTTASGGIVTSSADVTFPQATDNLGNHFPHWPVGCGNFWQPSYAHGVDDTRAIETGDVLKISSGSLTASLD
jgi:hypothetical protein